MGFGSNTASGLRSSYLHLCIRYYGKCAGIWDILYVAYSLTIWIAAVPAWIRRLRNTVQSSRPVQKLTHTAFVERYQNDLAFRGSIGIYEGIAVNFFYVVFRIVAGIRYASVWFLSIAVYYLVLGCLRTYLAVCYRHRTPLREYRCYRTTAWLLFL